MDGDGPAIPGKEFQLNAGVFPMRIQTRSLGEVEATPESFLTLPDGLVGYEGEREFALVSPARYAPFQWLLSFSDPELALPVIEARRAVPDYQPLWSNADRHALGAVESDALDVYLVANVDAERGGLTVNLRAPIVVHRATRLARQVVLSDGRYAIDHLVGSKQHNEATQKAA
jgi:flagellar assembly factor FliW